MAGEEEEVRNQPKVEEFVELSVAHRTHQKKTSIRLQIATQRRGLRSTREDDKRRCLLQITSLTRPLRDVIYPRS